MHEELSLEETEVEFNTVDGLTLRGTLVPTKRNSSAVLVHGAGSDRNEDGLFNKVALHLNAVGIGSLRFDLRGHGKSEGTRQSITLTSTLNDIESAIRALTATSQPRDVHLISSSFSGGITAYFAAVRGAKSLVLINPVLDYVRQYLTSKDFWSGTSIDHMAKEVLDEQGWIDHRGVLKLSRAFLGELQWIDPCKIGHIIQAPVLLFHGTKDRRVPYQISQEWMKTIRRGKLVLVSGADHEIAVSGDTLHEMNQTKEWHRELIGELIRWVSRTDDE